MIINKGEIFKTIEDQLFVSDDYVNTEKEKWNVPCFLYTDREDFWRIHTTSIKKVYTRKDYPEYYL